MRFCLQSISEYAFVSGMVTDFLTRVRAALKQDGVTPAGLARKAGLHRNTLYGADRDDWNPTADVLTKLEPFVEAIEAGNWNEPDADAPEKVAA